MRAIAIGTLTLFLCLTGPALAGEHKAAETAKDIQPALIGTDAPNAKLHNVKGEPVELANVYAKKPTVLVFYRGGWCPYCTTHLSDLRKIEGELLDMGFQVVALSPDKPEKLAESKSKVEMGYTLLSDAEMEAAKAFGIAFKVADETVERYKGYGINLEEASGHDHQLLPVPAVYIVGTDGVIRFSYVNPDYRVRLDSDVLLAAAKSVKKEEAKKKDS